MSTIVFSAVWPPFAAVLWYVAGRRFRWLRLRSMSPQAAFFFDWISLGVLVGVIDACGGQWRPGGASAGSAIVGIIVREWMRRRRRDRAGRSIGAKSRQIRDAIVRKAREAAKPRPVLKPAPVPR